MAALWDSLRQKEIKLLSSFNLNLINQPTRTTYVVESESWIQI